jgi:ParB family chromosome partitioning protein
MVDVENLWPHPDNPRKDLGDLTELTESIRKSGVMQNLTVIPFGYDKEPEEQIAADKITAAASFVVLIGHRRLAAAKEAGIEKVPCRIVSNISKSDQIAVMLEENMQRNDLTIYEQAQSFQLMLDLGETEDTISQKTGFGKTTIRHRLNIAKLDKRTMQRLDKDESFQLSLKDLYELEKVKDVKKRNEILRDAYNSRDLASRAIRAAKEEQMDEVAQKIIQLAEKRGIKPAGDDYANHRWDGTYTTIKEISLEEKAPERLRIGEDGDLLYYRELRTLKVVKKKPKQKQQDLSPYEIERKELEKKKKQIKHIVKEITNKIRDFIADIATGKVEPLKETLELEHQIWGALKDNIATISTNSMIEAYYGKQPWSMSTDEREAAVAAVNSIPVAHQMLLLIPGNIGGRELTDYNGKYLEDKAELIKGVISVLEPYGFSITDEEEHQIIDGTHELYTKPKPEKEGKK